MFICEIWLFDWYFPQFCTSDMSKYGYLEVFESVPSTCFDFEITRVDCIFLSPKYLNIPTTPVFNSNMLRFDHLRVFFFFCKISLNEQTLHDPPIGEVKYRAHAAVSMFQC